MNRIAQKMNTILQNYIRQTAGAIAVVFAVMAPVIVGAAGMAIDYSNAYLVQQRLSLALDASALAAAAASSEQSEIQQSVEDFLAVNYPPEKIGATIQPVVTVDGSLIKVDGVAIYSAYFLPLIGIEDITVEAETVVQREVKGLEVVMVLDNTGSMSDNNNISKLRTASCEFVEILYGTYDANEDTDCLDRYGSFVEGQSEFVKVGIVPYATSVNVGPYGLGYDDDGVSYDTAFLNNPADLAFSNDGNTNICVLEDDDGSDVLDHDGPWDMFRWCRRNSDDRPVCNYYSNYRCNYYNTSHSKCLSYSYHYGNRAGYRGPNYTCPRASVLPLTDNMTALKDRIGEMNADGWTFGNIGMVWGWRVLSPDYPFTEGVSWNDDGWRKVIVMMTDGDNVRSSPYGAYGRNGEHSVSSSSVLDDRLEEVCENMDEEDDVVVYTITFDTGGIDSTTEQLYKDCAVNGGRHEHVTTSDDLIDVFRDIATELSNLRIRS